MSEQLTITKDGDIIGEHEWRVKAAIARLKQFEPPDGYYVAFSGGKDIQANLIDKSKYKITYHTEDENAERNGTK